MAEEILGIHHITALASDPQHNLDFYTGALGLRLVKRTVNFDDPTTYHFYYGNESGAPGTILTFFPWPESPRGRIGTGQVTATAFSIPESSLDYWGERLERGGAAVDGLETRFGERVLTFSDPDGLKLELVAHAGASGWSSWSEGPVPAEHAIRGFHSATLAEEGYERTAMLLMESFGLRLVGETGNRFRYEVGGDSPGGVIDLVCAPDTAVGRMGAGTVHHIAWRVSDEAQQLEWRSEIANLGLNVTPVLDRQYFRSIYFREPGGVLFEIATDPPGFTADEALASLGGELKLPPWLESTRRTIEKHLPPVRLPETV